FLLARTENDSSEKPIEEDNWIAAMEWADSIGVDVVSSSLGYLDYDPPGISWTWQDMNGNTTLITKAADAAVARGIMVVNSAGNNGLNIQHNTLNAPADGDSVLTVGSVSSTGVRSSFSSVGPTTSSPPLIKPDVMARGEATVFASSTSTTGYTSGNGTSFSCPLTAGAVALIVQARPNATPVEIMNALRSTASRSSTPDNLYGWGIINTFAAMSDIPLPIQLGYFNGRVESNCVALRWGTISEIHNYGFDLQRSQDRITITTVPNSFVPGHGTTNEPHNYLFSDCNPGPGFWSYRLRQMDLDGTVTFSEWIEVESPTGVGENNPIEFALLQNYPNPFNPSTHIGFRIAQQGMVSLKLFDVLGREVATLINQEMQPGSYEIEYDAKNLSGGVYFYTLKNAQFVQTRKLVLSK
ncbi:MAG: S8 family serine peptidase, partial [bacterium]